MNKSNKRIANYFIIFSLLLIIGVVYAILQANLQINGTAKIARNTWNVHFENIVVNPDSVPIGTGDTGATIDPQNNCKVDFSVTLSLPGDFYEFTVDAKNEGTIDAMIGSLTKSLKVNNQEIELPDYLIYRITYVDDEEIIDNHLLAKGTKETYKVRVEFKSDINAEDLPEATTLSMSVEPTYIQADENATSVLHCPNQTVPMNNSVPNAPVLDTGMIPVTIANDGTVTTVSTDDPSWYNYQNKEWANAVLVKESGVKTRAQNKVVGTIINQNDILAYYVWIPRYKYAFSEQTKCGCIANVNENDYLSCYDFTANDEITQSVMDYVNSETNGAGIRCIKNDKPYYTECGERYVRQYNDLNGTNLTINDLSFDANLIQDRYYNNPRTIDIVFENANEPKSTGTAIGESYYTHPAFTFGSEELPGFWVGKFESSADPSSSCYQSPSFDNCDIDGVMPRVLPNADSLRYQMLPRQIFMGLKIAGGSVSNKNVTFSGSSTYGLTSSVDAHMMKNSEWGAAAYLSHSNYGINTKIRINNYSSNTSLYTSLTGCGTSIEDAPTSSTCDIPYGGATSYPQSTTGNITGIFDMSGGTWEYVLGDYDEKVFETGTMLISAVFPSKYYNNYPASVFTEDRLNNLNLCTLSFCGGHALNETARWYGDYAGFVHSEYPWFVRGGNFSDIILAGAFHANCANGAASSAITWRSVVVAR